MSVEKLLANNGIAYTISGKDFLIKCLNPEHDDSNPSLRVDRLNGKAHCFSCGWKQNLFKFYGVTVSPSVKLLGIKEKLNKLKVDMSGYEFPKGAVPYTKEFRSISVATLKKFEAFYTLDEEALEDRIVFPIRDIANKITSFVGRHILSDANPRYKTYPKNSTIATYPVRFEEKYTSMLIVEGIFDMLNLYDKGIHNVVCVFGTQTLKKDIGLKLLPYKAQGIQKIYVLFDGDVAGRDAAAELLPLIEDHGFLVENIDLPDDTDPGDLDQKMVNMIKEYIK